MTSKVYRICFQKIPSKEIAATHAVPESTGNMWIRIQDTLEENGINTVLANPYKTKIIAEAKIKSDKLDSQKYFLIC